jgi:hypothetical protein
MLLLIIPVAAVLVDAAFVVSEACSCIRVVQAVLECLSAWVSSHSGSASFNGVKRYHGLASIAAELELLLMLLVAVRSIQRASWQSQHPSCLSLMFSEPYGQTVLRERLYKHATLEELA